MQDSAKRGTVSIVLPVYNEEESLPVLHERIVQVMDRQSYAYELIYVDDGSHDRSRQVIADLVRRNSAARGIILRRNFGQSAATAAGIDHASGEIVVIMDSDLQNDPSDIPRLIERIEGGADIVSGWRQERRDNWIWRNLPSKAANWLIRRISGLPIHDLGCSLKAYRREIIKEVRLYGESHRFIAIYANMIGGKVEEVVVQHHPRQYGASKYGLGRVYKVLLDLITLKYLLSYATKPIYFFGKIALSVFFLALLSFGGLLVHKYAYHTSFVRSPFILLTSMILLVAFQTLLTGLIAELLMRIYHESQEKPVYYVREIAGSPPPPATAEEQAPPPPRP